MNTNSLKLIDSKPKVIGPRIRFSSTAKQKIKLQGLRLGDYLVIVFVNFVSTLMLR